MDRGTSRQAESCSPRRTYRHGTVMAEPRKGHVWYSYNGDREEGHGHQASSHSSIPNYRSAVATSSDFHPQLSHGASKIALCASATEPVPACALARSWHPNTPLGGIPLLATFS